MVVKLVCKGYDGCEFYVNEDLECLLYEYLLESKNDDFNPIILEYERLGKENKHCFLTGLDFITDIFIKYKEILEKHNLDGIIYYYNTPSILEVDICNKILDVFVLLYNWSFTDDETKEELQNNINIFTYAINTKNELWVI